MERIEEHQVTDVDTMLWHVGDFGRFQYILIILFSYINALSAFHYFAQTFISVEPEHRCVAPVYENFTRIEFSKCAAIVYNHSEIFHDPCIKWEYNNSYGYVSLVQEWNWICKNDWKSTVGQSVFFIGSVIGTLLFGYLADRIGRLHVLIMANVLAFIGNFCTVFSKDITTFGLARFISGAATDTNFVMMYMLVMEYIKPSMRTFGLNLTIGIFYCASSICVPWVAVLMTTWDNFLLVIAIPHLLIVFYYFAVPESAQWLISKGRIEEAIKCFKRIAKINRKEVGEKWLGDLKIYAAQNIKASKGHASFFGLLKTPKLRKKTIILIFKSMVLNLCYDAIARNVNGLGYSPFLIFSATSATIFPGCIVILLLQDKIGRKALAAGSLFLGGIFILIAGFVLVSIGAPDAMLTLILTVIARLNVIVAYNSGTQYAFELIPTEVRAQGVSVIHVAGFAATFFSPHVLYISKFWKPLPELVLGALLIIGATFCLFLPETLNRTLPVTLEDGELFGEDERIFEFTCCGNIAKGMTESTNVLTTTR